MLWSNYLRGHAERVYAVLTERHSYAAKALKDKIAQGAIRDDFKVRDIYRNGWSMLATKHEAMDAAEVLVDLGWLQAYTDKMPGTDGRPAVRYLINPLLRQVA